MRISDWSSDVCSSVLCGHGPVDGCGDQCFGGGEGACQQCVVSGRAEILYGRGQHVPYAGYVRRGPAEVPGPECRESGEDDCAVRARPGSLPNAVWGLC